MFQQVPLFIVTGNKQHRVVTPQFVYAAKTKRPRVQPVFIGRATGISPTPKSKIIFRFIDSEHKTYINTSWTI